jgi:hypothetical protein
MGSSRDDALVDPRAPWLTQVRRVRLMRDAKGEPVLLGAGGLARVLLGRLTLASGVRHRVAIKRPRRAMTDREALDTQTCIEALRNAGVRLPKMFVCPVAAFDDEGHGWAIVSQLFGSRGRGSKLSQPSLYFRQLVHAVRRDAVVDLTRIAVAGYAPALDVFVVLAGEPWRVVPIDLDLVHATPEPGRRVMALLRCVMTLGEDPAERRALLDVARATALGPLRAALEAEVARVDSPFRPYWQG